VFLVIIKSIGDTNIASSVYNSFKARIMDGTIDLDTHVINVALFSSAYSVDIDADEDWADISADEISGVGYTAGGSPLTVTISIDDTDDEGVFDAGNARWTNSTITARGAVIYDNTATSSPLICWIDFGSDKSSSSGDFKITFASEGILNLN